MTIWLELNCGKCSTINWLCAGDPQDISGVDPEGFICWSCKSHNIIDQDGEMVIIDRSDHDCSCDNGLQST